MIRGPGLTARRMTLSNDPLFVYGDGVIICNRCKIRWEQTDEPVRRCERCGDVPSIYDNHYRRAMEIWDAKG